MIWYVHINYSVLQCTPNKWTLVLLSADLCGLHLAACTLATINICPSSHLNLSNFLKALSGTIYVARQSNGHCKIASPCNFSSPPVWVQNYSAHRSSFSLPTWSKQIYVLRAVRPPKKCPLQNATRSAVRCKMQCSVFLLQCISNAVQPACRSKISTEKFTASPCTALICEGRRSEIRIEIQSH